MKIMIVNGGFLPARRYGGPVISIANLIAFLKEEFYIVTSDHECRSKERLKGIEKGWNFFNNHTKVLYLQDSEYSVKRFKRLLCEVKPDVVYINGFYYAPMYIPMIIAAQSQKIPLLIAPRGTLNKNAMALKRVKKSMYVWLMNMMIKKKSTFFQSTSKEETERIKKLLGAKNNHVYEVENVPSVPQQSREFPQKNAGELLCCFFARICQKKNLLGAIRILENVRVNVTFNIYGNIEEKDYWSECEKEIKKLPSNVRVNYVGEYDHEVVFELLSHNHVFLFPTLSENYGHVIVEAMLAGLPVIISDQTPWNDINEAGAGKAIALSREELFVKAIEEYAHMNEEEYRQSRDMVTKYIQRVLKLEDLKQKYDEMFDAFRHR